MFRRTRIGRQRGRTRAGAYNETLRFEVLETRYLLSFDSASSIGVQGQIVSVADFNQDNYMDMAVGSDTGPVTLLLGRSFVGGSPVFEDVGSFSTIPFGNIHSIVAADYNGDNLLDLIVGRDGAVELWQGRNIPGSYTFDGAGIYDPSGNVRSLAAGDFDGDAGLDLVTADQNGTVLFLRGSGTFSNFVDPVVLPSGGFSVAAADFNGDGVLDVVAASPSLVTLMYGRRISFGLVFEFAAYVPTFQQNRAISVGDINGDSRPDVVVGNDFGTVTLLRGAAFSLEYVGDFSTGGGISSLAVGDFNRDGASDVVAGHGVSTFVTFLRSQHGAQYLAFNFPGVHSFGNPLQFTVRAMNGAEVVTGYRGTMRFLSPNADVVVPANYAFTAADQGVYTFSAAVLWPGIYSMYFFDDINGMVGGFPIISDFVGADNDGDGLLDSWETNGLDLNGDGLVDLDLPALGANPHHKDLFVEVDAMSGLAPQLATLNRIVNAFAAVPNSLINNPDGLPGINLHIQLDEINLSRVAWPDVDAHGWPLAFGVAKSAHFGAALDRANPNSDHILNARHMVFRYAIFADRFGTTLSSGQAEISGNDFYITLGGGTSDQQAGTFMHELGHALGLKHGGGDHINYKPNYHSVMNYTWQFPQNSYDESWTLDYSRQAFPDLDESNLSEQAGIGGHAGHTVPVGPLLRQIVNEAGPVDWNRDGDFSDVAVAADINLVRLGASPSPGQILSGHEDWSSLDYYFRRTYNFADGVYESTVTEATLDEITQTSPLPGDYNLDESVDTADYVMWRKALGTTGVPAYSGADGDGDMTIDQDDYSVWRAHFGETLFPPQPPELLGDYNQDDTVDAADYVVWRKTLGATGVPAYSGADGDGDGMVGPGDYGVWRGHFGETLGAGSHPEGTRLGAGSAASPIEDRPATISQLSAAAPLSATSTEVNSQVGSRDSLDGQQDSSGSGTRFLVDLPQRVSSTWTASPRISVGTAYQDGFSDDALLAWLAPQRAHRPHDEFEAGTPVDAMHTSDNDVDAFDAVDAVFETLSTGAAAALS